MIENPNWQKVVEQLLEQYTQTELSQMTGITQSTISDIKNGKPKRRLSYVNGVALLKTLAKASGQKATQ